MSNQIVRRTFSEILRVEGRLRRLWNVPAVLCLLCSTERQASPNSSRLFFHAGNGQSSQHEP